MAKQADEKSRVSKFSTEGEGSEDVKEANVAEEEKSTQE